MTLVIGVVTVLTAGTVAVIGASRLAASQVTSRDESALRFLQQEITQRFSSAEAVASRVSAVAANNSGHASLDTSLGPIYDAGSGFVDEIVVADRNGRVLTAYPLAVESSSFGKIPAFRAAIRGVTGFSRDKGSDGTWGLWLTRTVVASGGVPVVVLMHVDLSSLRNAIAAASAADDRAVVVLEQGEPIIREGMNASLVMAQAKWKPLESGLGRATVPSADRGEFTGYYSDLQGVEGIAWRVAVLEPSSMVLGDTAIAVAPSITVLIIGGMVAVLAAWLMSRRLVEPLRALESAAYRAATGSYVKPIASDRDDEIGQVAEAFNAVALRLNALHDLSQLLASASQLDQVLDGILSAMGHIVGPGAAAIYLLDDSGRWLVPARVRGADVSTTAAIDALGDGWIAHALRDTDAVAHSGDARRIGDELPGLASSESVAIVAPLVASQEALGVVVVLRDASKPITEAEREMVRTFSAQAAVAVQNSRLFAIETESRRTAEGLRDVADRLVRPGSLEESLREVETVICELFGAKSAHFAIMDRAALGLPPAESDRAREAEILGFAMRILVRGGAATPVVVNRGEDAGADSTMDREGVDALLVVPIAFESHHGAVLMISLDARPIGQRDMELADAVANEIELALDNAYLFERAVVRAANLETIFRISQAVGSSLQVNVVLNRVLDVVQKILSADALALMTYDPRRRVISTAMARGAVSPVIVGVKLAPGEDVPGYVFSTGEPAAFRDLHEGMGGIAGDAASHGLRSMLAVPLLARGRSIGVLTVFASEAGAFSDEDMSVLQTFASQAALAIDTARLYSREHEVASILQASILPEAVPRFSEFDAASVYEPAGGESEIGGDYYDLFKAPDGAVWFAIADVCGKGVVAATKTSMIKYAVRSFVAAGLGPSAVLGEVNRMVTESGEASDIVTLWTGRYDPADRTLTWASGGHPPGLVLREASAVIERLSPTGPLLGALADVLYGESAIELEVGDQILLYTDGVTEARSGNDFFGEERVCDVLITGGTSEEIARRLLTVVRRFVHGDLRDDVAVLALTVRDVQVESESTESRSDS